MKKVHHDRLNQINESVEKQRKQTYESLTNQLRDLDSGANFVKKLVRLIPDNWEFSFDTCGWVTIHGKTEYDTDDGKPKKSDPEEFRQVVAHVERITGKELSRCVTGCDTIQLQASGYTDNGLYIRINQYNPTCKITYKTEKIPAQTKKIAIVPDECLGKKKDEQRQSA